MLNVQLQEDFSAGIVRSVEGQRIPVNGAYDIVNGLLGDDFALYRRGGSRYFTEATNTTLPLLGVQFFQTPAGARWLWWNASQWGVAKEDGSIVQLPNISPANKPMRPTSMIGLVVFPANPAVLTANNSERIMAYAYGGYDGSQTSKAIANVTITGGSRTVTTSATDWTEANGVRPGMILLYPEIVAGIWAPGLPTVNVIEKVNSSSSVTFVNPFVGSQTITSGSFLSHDVIAETWWKNPGTGPAPIKAVGSPARLLVGNRNRVHFSLQNSVAFEQTDYHELPTEATVTGIEGIRDTAIIFTTQGIWAINNLAYDLTDDYGNVQHTVEQINKDVILWHETGLANHGSQMIVPALDDVHLMDFTGQTIPITGAIRPLYRKYVQIGARPGMAATYRGHYFLPILDATNNWIDTLVCRLDGPQPAWTRWDGNGGESRAFAVRIGGTVRRPQLYGTSDTRITDLSDTFDPSLTVENDADGSAHELSVVTRDYASSAQKPQLVKFARMRYELETDTNSEAAVTMEHTVGPPDRNLWINTRDIGGEDTGEHAHRWNIYKRAQAMRFRIRTTGSPSKFVLRSLEVFLRPTSKS